MKKVLALILVLAMALSVAACAAPAEPAEPESTPAESTPAESKPEEEAAEPYTITVCTGTGPGVQEGWEAVKAGYEKLHPEATIALDLKANEGYNDWIATVGADYMNNDVDLANMNVLNRKPGQTINWDEYMEEVNPYDPEGRAWKDCFNYNAQAHESRDNSFDCLSLDSVQVTWFYNKGIFEEVGVKPPKTWDEMIEVCEKLAAAGYQPLSIPGDFTSFWAANFAWLAQIYVDQTRRGDIEIWRAHEGDYCYDPDIDGKFEIDLNDPWSDDSSKVHSNPVRYYKAIFDGEFSANTPGVVEVWRNFAKVFPKYAGGDAFFGTVDPLPAFYQGKAAITINVSGFAVQFANTMKKAAAGEEIKSGEETVEGIKPFELGMFLSPSMTNESGEWGLDEIFQAPARTIEVATGFIGSFSRDAKHDAHVVDFMMYYSSAAGMTEFVNAALPAGWTPAGASQVYGVRYPDEIQSAFESVEWIGNCQKLYCQALATGINEESNRVWYDLAQQCLNGKITPEEYAEKHSEQILHYLPDQMPKNISMSDLEHPELEPVGQDVE